MAYTHITNGALKTQLANQLGDPGNVYWPADELGLLLAESLRTWQALTGFWRDRGQFGLTPLVPFYDITVQLPALLAYTVTDQDLVGAIQYHLLEPKLVSGWSGTEMWTLADVTAAIQRQRNQLLHDTACRVVRDNTIVVGAGNGRVDLPAATIDIRRAAWVGADGTVTPLRRSDPLVRGSLSSSLTPATPRTFSVASEPVLRLELIPPPLDNGTLDLLLVQSDTDLAPQTSATVLNVPDDYCWIIKWGALADLLSKDGPGRDPQRAAYCRNRYTQAVDLLRTMPLIVAAEVNGIPRIPSPMSSLDCTPGWQTTTGVPRIPAIAAANMIAVYPVLPNDGSSGSVTLDVICNAPIPVDDGEFVQLGKEQLDAVLAYAEHLCLFKQGGANFYFSARLLNDFIRAAGVYNKRLAAQSRYRETTNRQSTAETGPNPARWKRERDVALQ